MEMGTGEEQNVGSVSRRSGEGNVEYVYVSSIQHKRKAKTSGVRRRSERIMNKNPMQFVHFIQYPDPTEPTKEKEKPDKKQKILVPPPEVLTPFLREAFYPTKPTPPPLSPEEREKKFQELLASQKPRPVPNKKKDWAASAYTIPPIPRTPLLYRITDATAAIAGWTPRADLPKPEPVRTREEGMELFRELQKKNAKIKEEPNEVAGEQNDRGFVIFDS